MLDSDIYTEFLTDSLRPGAVDDRGYIYRRNYDGGGGGHDFLQGLLLQEGGWETYNI